MLSLVRGQKIKLSDVTNITQIQVGLAITAPSGMSFDISCFGVDAQDKLSDDRYFIFFNQRYSPNSEISSLGKQNEDMERFKIDLSRLPSSIRKLVFTVTIDGEGAMSSIKQGYMRLLDKANELAKFTFTGADFSGEKAIIAGEIYFKDLWRFSAVGQGFNGGLSALLKHFGGQEITPQNEKTIQKPQPESQKKVSLSKVTLEKRGDKKIVDLTKKSGLQPIHINLNWDQNIKKTSFFRTSTIKADLDLGCMFELEDGYKYIVQALGNCFGSKDSYPFIYLDKDDRSGNCQDGENLYILQPQLIKRLMIFSYIYEGIANSRDVNGRVTIKDAQGNEINIKLNNPDSAKTFCVICTFTKRGNALEVTKQEQYFRGHQDADYAYKYGFQWRTGTK